MMQFLLVASALLVAAHGGSVRRGDIVNRFLLDGETACVPAASDVTDMCVADGPKPDCTPFRSVDFCGDDSFPTQIAKRTSVIKSTESELEAEGWWFHWLEDKLAGYAFAATGGYNPPKILHCTGDVPDGLDDFTPSSSAIAKGFVVRATNLHSNKGIFVLPNGFDNVELISGVSMSVTDIKTNLVEQGVSKIIIEEYVAGHDGMLPVEYKFHMFDGKVGSINIVYGRGSDCNCWAEIDTEGNRLDTYGCFTPGGSEQTSGRCTTIDFLQGFEKPFPMKGLDLCSEIPEIPECAMKDMIALAEKASKEIGVYMRVDMFVGGDGIVYLQEFSTNHMNGLRHCSARLDENACIDSCFQGRMWNHAGQLPGADPTLGGVKTLTPSGLSSFMGKNTLLQCQDADKEEVVPFESSCTNNDSSGSNESIPATVSPALATQSPVDSSAVDASEAATNVVSPSITTAALESSSPPSFSPSTIGSTSPSASDSEEPSVSASSSPSITVSADPTSTLSVPTSPSPSPTKVVSSSPSVADSTAPTVFASASPSITASADPTSSPVVAASSTPSVVDSAAPTVLASASPSITASAEPTSSPIAAASSVPSVGAPDEPAVTPVQQTVTQGFGGGSFLDEPEVSDKLVGTFEARYTITLVNLWTEENHPTDYPAGSAHWSPPILVTSNGTYMPWAAGSPATGGTRIVAEFGATLSYKKEAEAAGGTVVIGTSEFGDFQTLFVTFGEGETTISALSMIAPSPDWISGFYNVNPVTDGQWWRSFSIETQPFDAGTDSGTTYRSANEATDPASVITEITATAPPDNVFLNNGEVRPVALWRFELMEDNFG